MKTILALCYIFLLSIPLYGQDRKVCGYENVLKRVKSHPNYEEYLRSEREAQKNYRPNKNGDTVITIPVVVHVIYKNQEENISDAQINSQIDVLNEDYRKMNADTVNVAAGFSKSDVKLEFQLAGADPDGNLTTGITRTFTTIDDIGLDTNYYSLVPAWNRDYYLNIWVCDVGEQVLGFAYSPNQPGVSPKEDGVVIGPRYFGRVGNLESPFDRGRTTTHEVGHFLGLLHPWGSDANPSCNSDDNIADTPNQSDLIFDCPSSNFSCNSFDMVSNFMGYVDDACFGNFTLGQKDLMRRIMATARDSLQFGFLNGVISVNEIANTKGAVRIYPNPFTSYIQISIESQVKSEMLDAVIYDVNGRSILNKTFQVSKGLELSTAALRPGVYFLIISGETFSVSEKIIRQ